jgi:centromere protein C
MVEGDFTMRRSGRQHFRPLEYWRGEKFEYTRGQYGAQIKEVVKIAPDVVEPLTNRYKRGRSGRARSGSTKPSASVDPNEALEGWDELTDPIGVVKEFPSNAEIERRERHTFLKEENA